MSIQSSLSNLFHNMMNNQVDQCNFYEEGVYFGKCDDCTKVRKLIKVNNNNMYCRPCLNDYELINNEYHVDGHPTLDHTIREDIRDKALSFSLKRIEYKQQAIDELRNINDTLKKLLQLNNKMIFQLNKLKE